MKYKATIYRTIVKYDWNAGEVGESKELDSTELTAPTPEALRAEIERATGEKWENIERDDANEYPTKSEYWGGYTADQYGLHATADEIEKWHEGEMELHAVSCHILVSKLTEAKADL